MISCAAIQKLERYGYLGLKRHSTEDFVTTSIKDAKRVNVYALTLLETWKEAVQAVRGQEATTLSSFIGEDSANLAQGEATLTAAPARFTDALVYAMSFAVALTTQHVLEVAAAAPSPPSTALFPDDYAAALQLLTTLKEMGLAIGSGRALRSNASSEDFTKATAHLLTNVLDLVLVLLSTHAAHTEQTSGALLQEQMLAQGLVLTASVAQTLRRVQASYPVADLYNTRTCSALLKQVANKHKQQQKNRSLSKAPLPEAASMKAGGAKEPFEQQHPLFELLQRYVCACMQSAAASSANTVVSAASLFSVFSLFQRLSVLHGTLSAVVARPATFALSLRRASEDVQHWLSQLLSSTACNRATRYVVYFREDELRLMQHNIRQSSEYALYTFTTTPPVDPGVVEALLAPAEPHAASESRESATHISGGVDDVTHARAALVLAQWCVSAPFFFESFCQDETWAAFAQEQRRLVLLQQSRARRGMEKSTKGKKDRRGKSAGDGKDNGNEEEATTSATSRSSSVSSRSSDTGSVKSSASNHSHNADTASLLSFQTASHLGTNSVGGSVTSLASRVSLLSTFSKHSAASYLSFLSVLRPSTMGSVAGGGDRGEDRDDGVNGGERQMHESEDGNTNLPLILLEQLTLGLHRFMESYPVDLLDAYGLRSISWTSIARMFAFVEASLTHTSAAKNSKAAALPQPLFTLAQDIRYNKGMGYECLGLLFAKAVAPLLDVNGGNRGVGGAVARSQRALRGKEEEEEDMPSVHAKNGVKTEKKKNASAPTADSSNSSAQEEEEQKASREEDSHDVQSVDGNRTEDGFFAHAAAASAVVGRASLSITDDAVTRRSIEEALSTCLTAYETVAPQVVDMNLATIVRLAARTAVAATEEAENSQKNSAGVAPAANSWSQVLMDFLQDITRRLGRNNELPHFVDALLGRGEAAAGAAKRGAALSDAVEVSNLAALRTVFRLAPVRRALIDAAAMSLDPESLLLHLTSIAAEVEEDVPAVAEDKSSSEGDEAEVGAASPNHAMTQKQLSVLLTLEVMEAVLEGVVPTSVSASAVLEQTTQLELLLTASFMKCVEAATEETVQQQRLVAVQHACTIRQCRAVTALCLQDLGSQQVHEYLIMLNETLWQLSTDIGQLIGSLTLADLQPWLAEGTAVESMLLLPSLVLQRLSLARAVTAALGTTAGPAEQLQDLVAYIWYCIGGANSDAHASDSSPSPADSLNCASLLLANEMSGEDWASVVALGKEKHARAAMVSLLARSSSMSTIACAGVAAPRTAWLECCLRSIPGTTLRALVDVYVSLSVEDLYDEAVSDSSSSSAAPASRSARQWFAILASLADAYEVVGRNPYWPSVLAHTVRAVTHLTRVWRKAAKSTAVTGGATALSGRFQPLVESLVGLLVCVLRSEARASEVLRKTLLTQLRESAVSSSSSSPSSTKAPAPALSRSGMTVEYVKSIKVPATVLSDLSAPTALAEADADAQAEQLAAYKDLSFENELRDLCALLFNSGLIKHLFTLVDLTVDSTAPVAAAVCATSSSCMATLAFLYQIALATAQTAWRSRVTEGSIEALRKTDAVVFLHTVAQAFHTRTQALQTEGVNIAAALMSFLEPFSGEAGDGQLLLLHIASQRATVAASSSSDNGALDDVEACWMGILCHCATSVMSAAVSADASCNTNSTAELFRMLFARLWASAQHKQQHSSKSGHHGGSGAAAAAASSVATAGKRSRHEEVSLASTTTKKDEAKPLVSQTATTAVTGGVREFLRDVLTGVSHGCSAEDAPVGAHAATARQLRHQLSQFFGAQSDRDVGEKRKKEVEEVEADVCVRRWHALCRAGGESTVCAWWLLWELFTVSSTLPPPATSATAVAAAGASDKATQEKDTDIVHRRVASFLTTSVHRVADEDAVALRAGAQLLHVLPTEAVPPLFLDHLDEVLTRVISNTEGTGRSLATNFTAQAVPAAVEILLELFRVRPRLPAWRLLPHAQRLLVALTHPSVRAAASAPHSNGGPSLCTLALRLCAAVAGHPLVASSAVGAGLQRNKQQQHQQHPVLAASEMLDNVWLLLLALAQGETQSLSAPVVALQESEIIQLILLLTKTWLRSRQQQLWSRPAMLPPLMCALFTSVMSGVESARFTPRVLNVLAGGLAAMAAHVDAATAAAGDAEAEEDEDAEMETGDEGLQDEQAKKSHTMSSEATTIHTPAKSVSKRRKTEHGPKRGSALAASTTAPPTASAQLKRMALTASTSALFEVAQHYVHVFTTFSSDMDFLFTDFLRVLSQHFLPRVTRPPIAYHAGVRIGGTTQSEMTFADLAYMCVGNAESKSLLKQAALRMEEEDGGAAGALGLTDGSRSIFRVA